MCLALWRKVVEKRAISYYLFTFSTGAQILLKFQDIYHVHVYCLSSNKISHFAPQRSFTRHISLHFCSLNHDASAYTKQERWRHYAIERRLNAWGYCGAFTECSSILGYLFSINARGSCRMDSNSGEWHSIPWSSPVKYFGWKGGRKAWLWPYLIIIVLFEWCSPFAWDDITRLSKG